jgi:superfamily I DNA/RNA helicase
MELTVQQDALVQYCLEGSTSFMGVARAGTGKTFTLQLAAQEYNKKFPEHAVLGMAFNRSIANVLAERITCGTIKTAHGFGYGAWMRRSNQKIKRVNTKKNFDIIKEIGSMEGFTDLAKAASICKAWGLVPNGAPAEPRGYLADEPDSYKMLFDNYNIDTDDSQDPIGLVRELLMRSITRGWKGDIDFDDQIYLPTIYNADFPKADLLLLDEAQDLNPIQRYMAKQMLKPGGRLFGLGDDCQAIYGFRGADRDSIEHIVREFECEILPLTVSFRCPKAVVLRAQEFVPDIEPFEDAIDGSVVEVSSRFSLSGALNNKEESEYSGRIAILCRNNAPLISAALKLIENDIGAIILGRDLEKGLIHLVDKQKAMDLRDLNVKLHEFIARQADLLTQRGATKQADLIHDKGRCLYILIDNEGADGTIQDLKRRIKTLFSDKEGSAPVTLSTIHKAKGMEWPNVFILDKELMPSKFAKTPAEIQQENNLHYVAITRAQKQLVYITSENI